MRDKNGESIKMGDFVTYTDMGGVSYKFCIESISGGWIWGSDIPADSKYSLFNGEYNHHNPLFCELTPQNTWGNSKLEFKFI
jgi:hypothetical protein